MQQDQRPATWTDHRMETMVGNLLRSGVIAAAVVVAIGAAVYLARHGTQSPAYSVFQGEPSDLRSVVGILKFAFTLHGRGIVQLGCLLLIATPVMRVALSLVAFAAQRDRTYVVVTLLVLALLAYSLLGGRL